MLSMTLTNLADLFNWKPTLQRHIFSLNAQTPQMPPKWCDVCLALRLDKHARLSLPHCCGDAIVPVFNIFFLHSKRATQSTGWRIQLFMQQTEKLGLLRFCQWGQAEEHICHTQISLKFTLKSCRRLLQILKSFWRHYFTTNYFHFFWVRKCHSFALIIYQLYKMLFNSIFKSVIDWFENRWKPLVRLEGRCAALDDLGCFSVWHILGYLCFTQLKDCLVYHTRVCYLFQYRFFQVWCIKASVIFFLIKIATLEVPPPCSLFTTAPILLYFAIKSKLLYLQIYMA